MPKIIYSPIGKEKLVKDQQYFDNLKSNQALEENLFKKKKEVFLGWGEKYIERVHEKNKLTAWERIKLLADNISDILPIGSFVNWNITFENKSSPMAGVITAFVKVNNLWVIVIANDNTVASGSWWPKTPEKIIRAQEIALKLSLPVVYLVDCSGLFLPEQGKTFPGKTGAGKIFKMNSLLSAKGVPQIAGVCGDCIAGGGYMPIISDKVFMTEKSYMVIAGSALIKGAKGQSLSSHDIGGAHVHVPLSRCADERVPDDEILIEKIKSELKKLPSSACDYYRYASKPMEPKCDEKEILGLLPNNPQKTYDIKEILARLLDLSLFFEYAPHIGLEVFCGLGKINGLNVGFLANVQDLLVHPKNPEERRPGGILYKEGVAKLSSFVRLLNDDGIPIVWLQDVSGFDVGLEAEKQGLLSYGSSLIYANATINTPMMTILLRKASGAGYYAMAGMPYDPVLQISTPLARLAVMEGKTLALGALHTKLSQPEVLKAKKEIEDKIEADMDPYKSASQMDTDEIVSLSELRSYLCLFAECSYQTIANRRIKNPRIWSIYDQIEFFNSYCEVKTPASKNIDLPNKNERYEEKDYLSIKSPMDGMIYLRPAPEEDYFVKINEKIYPGQTVALIEVMKCFYPIKYNGDKETVVKNILIRDQSLIKNGSTILLLAK